MAENQKPKFAMYWSAACGGCEIAVLNIGEKILEVDSAFEVVFWPVALDFKYHDVRDYPDGYIDLCLFNGAIRTSENEAMAHLLRQKSKVLVAFGACATGGGIPALANLTNRTAIFEAAYLNNPSTRNPERRLPNPSVQVPEGELHIPTFYNTAKSLGQVVEVDYTIPGCPPEPHQIWAVLEVVIAALQHGAALPPKGSVLGASSVSVCKECELEKGEKQIRHLYRPFELIPEPGRCLLEQGLVCLGPATRGGCGALCPKVGMGCRGCYGALEGLEDQGARFLAAIASVIDIGAPTDNESELEQHIQGVMDTLADPAGTFYRFSLANSLLNRARLQESNGHGREAGDDS
jgi:F420-non-reducing hydrogenase small subunit